MLFDQMCLRLTIPNVKWLTWSRLATITNVSWANFQHCVVTISVQYQSCGNEHATMCVSAVDVFHTNVKTMAFHDTKIFGKM